MPKAVLSTEAAGHSPRMPPRVERYALESHRDLYCMPVDSHNHSTAGRVVQQARRSPLEGDQRPLDSLESVPRNARRCLRVDSDWPESVHIPLDRLAEHIQADRRSKSVRSESLQRDPAVLVESVLLERQIQTVAWNRKQLPSTQLLPGQLAASRSALMLEVDG